MFLFFNLFWTNNYEYRCKQWNTVTQQTSTWLNWDFHRFQYIKNKKINWNSFTKGNCCSIDIRMNYKISYHKWLYRKEQMPFFIHQAPWCRVYNWIVEPMTGNRSNHVTKPGHRFFSRMLHHWDLEICRSQNPHRFLMLRNPS